MIAERRTLRDKCKLNGCGLHSGNPVAVTIHPGRDGIGFRSGPNRWPAAPENVTSTRRCTQLGGIGTVEHLMSAFAGLQITDAEVEVEGIELPGLDGSSLEYVRALCGAGLEILGTFEVPEIFKRVFVQEGAVRLAASDGSGQWKYIYQTGERWPGEQVFESNDVVADFEHDIAPARTFALAEEIPALRENRLGLGLDETSAVIIEATGYRHPPRFDDEPARHKMLDLMGDLYLSGVPARALNVVSERSGHKANVEAAYKIRQLAKASRRALGD